MLEKPGCPLCHVAEKVGRAYLENLLWASVNDPELRGKLDESLGFCGRHSRDLFTFSGERLGTAIIQQAMLKEALRRLHRAQPPGQRSVFQRIQVGLKREGEMAAEAAALPPKGACPVCQHQHKWVKRSREELLAHLVGDLDAPLRAAGGLCWDHLDQALATGDAQTFAALVELHAGLWEETIGHLGEFIRKRDYRFSHEPVTEAEASSMQRAIAILTGEYPPP
jgi:hypothetical protein